MKKALQPKQWIPRGPYSLGTQLGNLVFLSGQIAQDNDGKAIGADVKAQTAVIIDKIEQILAEAGMGLDDVMSTTVYLQSLGDYAAMNEVYSARFKGVKPARATVRADLAGAGLLVEISAIAARA
ncbi:MAG TPA: RidA family protein [Caldimonas sp.]|nr:RidA family protein [Caldimonas sp.]